MSILQHQLADKLFASTGIESYELDAATEFLGLEQNNEEYKAACADYMQ